MTAASVPAQTTQSQPPSAPPSSLAWYAQIAKARGQSHIEIANTPEADYTSPLGETMRHSIVVRARVSAATVDWSDGFQIFRWYVVAPQDRFDGPEVAPDRAARAAKPALKAAAPGELVVRVRGGTAVVGEVSITMPGPAALARGRDYLLFLTPAPDGFFELSFATQPVVLDEAGNIDAGALGSSTFARELARYRSFAELRRAM